MLKTKEKIEQCKELCKTFSQKREILEGKLKTLSKGYQTQKA